MPRTVPSILYHASPLGNLTVLRPQRRYTPETGGSPPERVYASDLPGYSIAHGFPWNSLEGFQLSLDDPTRPMLVAPYAFRHRLDVQVTLYTVPADRFQLLPDVIPYGHNFYSVEEVSILTSKTFSSIAAGIEHFGGHVHFRDPNESEHRR